MKDECGSYKISCFSNPFNCFDPDIWRDLILNYSELSITSSGKYSWAELIRTNKDCKDEHGKQNVGYISLVTIVFLKTLKL